ncbi:MAG: PorT family protein [Bacteroidales bacterium]|nr:PorT family protein [Bacteroidales bacterium]
MRESRHALALAIVAAVLWIAVSTPAQAQKYYLELKAGAAATSTSNSLADKTILESRIGTSIGAAFGLNLMDGTLRAMGECNYTCKGERYMIEDIHKQFDSEINYLETSPTIRYYTPWVPVYVGAGFYIGGTSTRNAIMGDTLDQSHAWQKQKYYKAMDFGTKVALGTEIGVGSIRFVLEGAYEYGLANVSDRKARKIKNRALVVTMGLNFQIYGKHYRRY